MTTCGRGDLVVHKGLIAPFVVIALLATGCLQEPASSSSGVGEPSGTSTTRTSETQPRPTADPPEEFAVDGVTVGPDNVHVGYHAAFSLSANSGDTDAVVATDLATGDEVWKWNADSGSEYGSSSDEPLAVLALSRENDTERLQFTGVHRTEGSGTQRATAVLRTTVLDTATGDVLGRGGAALPAEFADVPMGSAIDARSVGLRGRYAVSTVSVSGSLPMTLVTDLTSGSAALAGRGFLATGLGVATAIGTVTDEAFSSNDTLQAVALDTRRPVWSGGTVRDNTVETPAPSLVTAVVFGDNATFVTHVYDSASGRQLAVLDDVTTCEYDQRDVVVCSGMASTIGLDATTARQLWRLPDEAANRVDPGLDAAFHGRVYAHDVILDARTGRDVVPSLSITADTVVPGYAISRSGGEAVAHPAT